MAAALIASGCSSFTPTKPLSPTEVEAAEEPASAAIGSDEATPKPPSDDAAAARAVVERLQARLVDLMEQGSALNQKQREDTLRSLETQSFDIPFIAAASLADLWPSLTQAQRSRWIEVFGRFHLSAMADSWGRRSGGVFVVLGVETAPSATILVRTLFNPPNTGVDVYFDYRIANRPAGYQIIDVLSPPMVSEVAMRRAEYRSILRNSDFDTLVERMEKQIARRQGR